MRSRVMPGSSVTIARLVPVKRLNNVDLPTLGRPTITSDGKFCAMNNFVPRDVALRKKVAGHSCEFVERAQMAHRSRKPQQDVSQLYRIAASVQSRLKWTQTSANGTNFEQNGRYSKK